MVHISFLSESGRDKTIGARERERELMENSNDNSNEVASQQQFELSLDSAREYLGKRVTSSVILGGLTGGNKW